MMTRSLTGRRLPQAAMVWFGNLSRGGRLALLASILWGVLVAGYGLGYLKIAADTQIRGMAALDGLFLLMALVLPIGLIWLAAGLGSTLRVQREMTEELADLARPLIAELEETRRALAAQQGVTSDAVEQTLRTVIQTRQRADTDLSEGLTQVSAGQARLETALASLISGLSAEPAGFAEPAAAPITAEPAAPPSPRQAEKPASVPVANPDEPTLPHLEATEEEAARPAWPDLVRAFDFPKDDQDFEGFRALQAVLRYPPLAQMLQAAEDVLTLLSQEGVYMEDLAVVTGEAGHWRRFMAGERGADVASVGGIRDDQALELTRTLLKTDSIFRDSALFFQRRFDRVLQDFAREAGDQEIIDVANTRSGRAFMLLARLNGAFD
ncbi:hypothetical protein [Amaricoccus macauensis]|uniref:hypothetical protein n=1 Tax=Amaricoccus macauensis TaxID=57001 RepID=UPI003C7D3CEB